MLLKLQEEWFGLVLFPLSFSSLFPLSLNVLNVLIGSERRKYVFLLVDGF